MAVATLEVGDLAACCYIVGADAPGGGEPAPCVVIDPGAEAGRVSAAVRRAGLRVETVLLTHAHADHIGGVAEILADWPGAVLACSEKTSQRAVDPQLNLSVYLGDPVTCPPAGRVLRDGEAFSAAGMDWKAVELPGHEPGEMVYVLGDGVAAFTGDTVFAGSIGRSDFPGGNAGVLLAGIRRLLESLPPDAVLYPGHGPSTRVRDELAHNPFLV